MLDKKEVVAKPAPTTKVDYEYAGKESLGDVLKKTIPSRLIPTKKTADYLGYIFLAVVVLAFFQFPFGDFLSGDIDVTVRIGYPLTFFEMNLSNPEAMPLRFGGLVIDLIIYLFLAYSIEVVLNSVLDGSMLKSDKEKESLPKVFSLKKKTLVEKATDKVIEKTGQEPVAEKHVPENLK